MSFQQRRRHGRSRHLSKAALLLVASLVDTWGADTCEDTGELRDGSSCAAPVAVDDADAGGAASNTGSSLAAAAVSGDGTQRMAYPRLAKVERQKGAKIWTAEELLSHSGTDPEKPLLLAVIGEVFDVGPGARFYAPGMGYASFAGRDGCRGLATGDFSEAGMRSDILDLESDAVHEITGWRDFYRKHAEYRFVGFLEGRYYKADGDATAEKMQVDLMQDGQKKMVELEAAFKRRFIPCNTKHVQAHKHFEIWCDDSYHRKGSLPLHVYYKVPSTQEMKSMCACIPPEERKVADREAAGEAAKPGAAQITFRLVDYPECTKGKQKCTRPKGAKPP